MVTNFIIYYPYNIRKTIQWPVDNLSELVKIQKISKKTHYIKIETLLYSQKNNFECVIKSI